MTLRARLLIGMVVIAIVLAATGAAIVRLTRTHLVDQVDAELVQFSRRRAIDPRSDPFEHQEFSALYVAVVTSDGRVSYVVEPNLTDATRTPPDITAERALRGTQRFTVGSDDSDLRYRVLSLHFPRQGGAVVYALPLDRVDDAIARLVRIEVIAAAAILAVLALVTWWVVHLGVRPLKRMTAAAAAIGAGDLSARVPDERPGTEAAELGAALNRMLGRIEEAFDERTRSESRLRQFVGDASHELRTPVTTIRGYAELYRTGALDTPGQLDEAMRRTEQEAVRMGTLIDDLLHLARLDQGRPIERAPVDLVTVVHDAVSDARAVDPHRPLSATVPPQPVTVIGDDARLRQVVANLVGNALIHTPAGTPVDVRVASDPTAAVVEVADHGPGMSEEVAARAFERFYRADPSRSRHHGGSGLGLAIVDATVRAHGGTVVLDTAPGRGTTVRVRLPLAEAPAPSAT